MGRYSNGPVWVDYLAAKLGVPDPQPSLAGGTNYAYGGATAGDLNPNVPNLGQQVQAYLATSPKADPKAVYAVWMGSNDFGDGQTDPSIPAGRVDNALSTLVAAGARTVLVSNLGPSGITPLELHGGRTTPDALIVQFNADLAADVQALRASNPGVRIALVDLYSNTKALLSDPAAYGITNVTDEGILAAPGTDLSQYLWWDGTHPTTAAHALIADGARAALSVPEPTGLTLVAACGVGLAVRAWRRKRAA